jgi:hypothetical protein
MRHFVPFREAMAKAQSLYQRKAEEGLTMKTRSAMVVVSAFVVFGACAAQAAHKDVKHCADDYKKYCHQWGLETKGLENCMRKHGDRLTNACIAALVKAGEISQAEVDRRKKQLAHKK